MAVTPARPAPRVSICVVSCDRLDTLRVTIETTRASLATCSIPLEWIIFDNGSTAPVRDYLATLTDAVVLPSPQNIGLAPALDALLRESHAPYILTLEDDWKCLASTPAWLDAAVAILDTMPDVGVVRLRKLDDGQCGHFKRHRRDVALRHHPWSIEPLPDIVETRRIGNQPFYVAPSEYVNWTNNPTLHRRTIRDWLGPFAAYLPDPRDHRPRDGHPGLEGAIDAKWRPGPWKVAKLREGPFTHVGDDRPAVVAVELK